MKLAEIADKIHAHLKRFEVDPKLNPPRVYDGNGWRDATAEELGRGKGLREFYGAGASASGRFVSVRYVSYQGGHSLTKADALKYLAWLDAGNVGRHWTAGVKP